MDEDEKPSIGQGGPEGGTLAVRENVDDDVVHFNFPPQYLLSSNSQSLAFRPLVIVSQLSIVTVGPPGMYRRTLIRAQLSRVVVSSHLLRVLHFIM